MLSFLLATSALLAPHQASRTRVASIAMSDVEKTTGPDVSLAASQAKAELRAAQSAAAAAWRNEEKTAQLAAADRAALAALNAKVESLQAEVDAAPSGGSMPAFFKPFMSTLYDVPSSLAPALIRVIHSARKSRLRLRRSR